MRLDELGAVLLSVLDDALVPHALRLGAGTARLQLLVGRGAGGSRAAGDGLLGRSINC